MKTVVSKTGIEVLYPCTIHLLTNGAKVECEYRSEQIGKDLLDYICEYLNLEEKNFWGLRFVDVYEQRYWLEPNKLIRSQVKNSCPVHFHFRVKIYPPEPFKLFDEEAKYQIFMQLRFDLVSGRLKCGSTDSAMLIGLILQYTYGDYDPTVHFGNYVQEKILLNQTFNIEMRAIAVHKSHLRGLSMDQAQDLFLRMASQLETYGIDPHQVEDSYGNKLTLWINHEGMKTYNKGEEVDKYEWMSISDIDQEDKKIELNLVSGDSVTLHCLTDSECLYIFQEIQSYFSYFTTFGAHSTLGQIDNESEVDNDSLDTFDGSESEIRHDYFSPGKHNEENSPAHHLHNFLFILFIIILCFLAKIFYRCNVNIFENFRTSMWFQYDIKKYLNFCYLIRE